MEDSKEFENNKDGKWMVWTRGTKPAPWEQWREATKEETDGGALNSLATFLRWQAQGQHVRLEWMPNNAYGQNLKPGE